MAYSPRLKEEYKSRVIAALTEEFGYKNVMQVPKLKKIVILLTMLMDFIPNF